MLEVTMADHPGQLCPPMFSWNVGMVMHVLKNDRSLGSWSTCRWMAQGLLICSYMIGRTAVVWVRILHMRSGLMWRRLFQSGSHILLTSPFTSYLWWRPGSGLLPLPTIDG